MNGNEKEQLWAAWCEGALSLEDTKRLRAMATEDPDLAARLELTEALVEMGENASSSSLSNWDRSATYTRQQIEFGHVHWWQSPLLPATSLAASLLAIALVLTGFQLEVSEGSINVAFGSAANRHNETQLRAELVKEMEKTLTEKMDAWQAQQALVLTQHANELRIQQLEANAELTAYVLKTGRQERQEDFSQFVSYINEQRQEDRRYYGDQLRYLEASANNPQRFWSSPYERDEDGYRQ